MTAKEHYDKHLGNFYSWMAGDFNAQKEAFKEFLKAHTLLPSQNNKAIDLGAGHGIQTVALAKLGYKVTAIDFNSQLLKELKEHTKELPVNIVEGDIKAVNNFADLQPALIVCWGDTLMHLANKSEIETLIADCAKILASGGKLLLSFRDYTFELQGVQRFIPVKSDAHRILTCILEYLPDKVQVTDLLYEKTPEGWQQKVSTYQKVKIVPTEVAALLQKHGFKISYNEPVSRFQTVIAEKI
ncbi:class I SAM-dependent methyltransferase [Chondrinema litorale]|uniref:class I SAM-dependent methyltransferase n=1 Tax=Chondrinema litorale TaxID=2994555 RepID=UPI0025438594|nr:class I SAM-dependent methyltransferase [Chondrinema litorale]UZR95267.1 class I SAM-dependent methyltransferase [Chondrinema litorale]